jgi:hypothetical protein
MRPNLITRSLAVKLTALDGSPERGTHRRACRRELQRFKEAAELTQYAATRFLDREVVPMRLSAWSGSRNGWSREVFRKPQALPRNVYLRSFQSLPCWGSAASFCFRQVGRAAPGLRFRWRSSEPSQLRLFCTTSQRSVRPTSGSKLNLLRPMD